MFKRHPILSAVKEGNVAKVCTILHHYTFLLTFIRLKNLFKSLIFQEIALKNSIKKGNATLDLHPNLLFILLLLFYKISFSPLTLGAKLGTPKILELMIEADADINAVDKNGHTALYVGAFHFSFFFFKFFYIN